MLNIRSRNSVKCFSVWLTTTGCLPNSAVFSEQQSRDCAKSRWENAFAENQRKVSLKNLLINLTVVVAVESNDSPEAVDKHGNWFCVQTVANDRKLYGHLETTKCFLGSKKKKMTTASERSQSGT